MRPTIYLFDIDGTLLPALGLGRRAMNRVFEEQFGHTGALDRVRFEGMTDRPIVRQALAALDLLPTPEALDATIDRVLARYIECLRDEVARAPSPLPLLPGVVPALDAVAACPGAAVGLGTGNVRIGAEIKLRAAGLWERFAFGGFACDHDDRGTLLRIGADRGAALVGVPRPACRVVVIGDTPRDIDAAREIGAECVAVGTSRYTPADLVEAGAPLAFADMTSEGFIDALTGPRNG